MRTIVISDCHGSPWLVSNALKHSEYQKESDRLVFAGDFVDIGDSPEACWKLLVEEGAELLWGNHEVAIVIRQYVGPQDPYSWTLREDLIRKQKDFKIATSADNILITHAGLSEVWGVPIQANLQERGLELTAQNFADVLNANPLPDIWDNTSPLWYRPSKYIEPYPRFVQVCGHTPPESIPEQIDYYSVDPYSRKGFGKNRYRYALIEDEKVKIFDSNVKD